MFATEFTETRFISLAIGCHGFLVWEEFNSAHVKDFVKIDHSQERYYRSPE